MKAFITILAMCFSIHAFATQTILPEDLEESEYLLVKKISVTWDKPVDEFKSTWSCDGIIWNRTLLLLPADVPFDLSFHEFLDYQDEFLSPSPGKAISGLGVWKQDQQNGTQRLLFKGLKRVFIILRSKTLPAREVRIGIHGSC